VDRRESGCEASDKTLLDLPAAAPDIVITNTSLAGRTSEALALQHGLGAAPVKLVRGGEALPAGPSTITSLAHTVAGFPGATPDVPAGAGRQVRSMSP